MARTWAPCATTVASNGDVFAALGRGPNGVLALRDTNGDGIADVQRRFGPASGSGIALQGGYLYFAPNDRVLRWRWEEGQLEPAGEPEVIVRDLPIGGHGSKRIAVSADGRLYVTIGSGTNSCQVADRQRESPGIDPCPELATRAGIWRFAAGRTGQTQQDGERVATGLRNPMALALQPGTGTVYAGVNGRDQPGDWGWSAEDNAEKPAEEFIRVEPGSDFGWPYCFYDPAARKKLLNPEYGGDGRAVGRCASKRTPEIGFPGHWAPLGVTFYSGTMFGDAYRGGAFIAFHGWWNRAPLPQAGYRVVFVPFRNERITGEYRDFVTPAGNPTGIRPVGLAVGPDGSLYVGADANGKIWRIIRQ